MGFWNWDLGFNVGLRRGGFAATCAVVVLAAFLCGCESKTDSKDKDAYQYVDDGVVHLKARRYADAVTACRKAIALKPDCADAYCGMGCAWLELKKYPDALAAFEKAVAIEPENMFALSSIGRSYEWLKQYRDAIAVYRRVIAIRPRGKYAYLARQRIRDLLEKLRDDDIEPETQPGDSITFLGIAETESSDQGPVRRQPITQIPNRMAVEIFRCTARR